MGLVPPWAMTRSERLGWTTAAVIFGVAAYHLTTLVTFDLAEPRLLPIGLDDAVPLDTRWLPIYLAMYAQALTVPCAVDDLCLLKRWALGMVLMYAVAVPIWVLVPVTVPRDPVPVVDYFSYLLALFRAFDPPSNCLPSMHVAVSFWAAHVVWRVDRPVGTALFGLGALIWYSTMATDQHWFVDGLAGFVLAAGMAGLLLRGQGGARLPRVWHLFWMAALATLSAGIWAMWHFGLVTPDQLPPLAPPML